MAAMESVFDQDHRVSASLVELMYKDACSFTGAFLSPAEILQTVGFFLQILI